MALARRESLTAWDRLVASASVCLCLRCWPAADVDEEPIVKPHEPSRHPRILLVVGEKAAEYVSQGVRTVEAGALEFVEYKLCVCWVHLADFKRIPSGEPLPCEL